MLTALLFSLASPPVKIAKPTKGGDRVKRLFTLPVVLAANVNGGNVVIFSEAIGLSR
jgi:hypothetical protein